MTTATYSHFRENLAKIWDRIENTHEPVVVQRRGHQSLAILPADELASLRATAHLLKLSRNAVRLRTALQRMLSGSTDPVGLNQLGRELGLDRSR